jgi:hypothetical protein
VICGDRGYGDALYVKGGRQETALLTIIGCPGVIVLQCAPAARAQAESLMVTTCFLLTFCSVCLMVDRWRAESSEGVRGSCPEGWCRRIITRSLCILSTAFKMAGSPGILHTTDPRDRSSRASPGPQWSFSRKRQARGGHLGIIDGFHRALQLFTSSLCT